MRRLPGWIPALLPFIPVVLYFLLPNHNPGSDAWGYTALELKRQAQGTPYFSPHHLLFHEFGHFSYRLLPVKFMDFMGWMQVLNAFFGGLSLWFFYKISLHSFDKKTALVLTFLVGSTFGIIRFATENETYVIPITLSLAGSLALLKRNNSFKWLYAGFLLLGLAVLFHQIHIWWWLAAVIALGLNKRALPAVFLSLIAVVGSYMLAANSQGQSWLSFPFSDAFSGTVQIIPDFNNVKFTAINLLRTLLQIHGNILYFLKANSILAGLSIMGLVFMVVSLFQKNRQNEQFESWVSNNRILLFFRLAAFFHLLWAFYSVGNAEFMVMLPFLGLLSFPAFIQRHGNKFLALGAGLLFWNISVYSIPHKVFRLSVPDEMINSLRTFRQDNKALYYISRQKVLLENYAEAKRIDLQKMNVILLSAPSDRGKHTIDQPDLDTLVLNGHCVITDCREFPEPTSRGSILAGNGNSIFLKKYKLQNLRSVPSFFGNIQMDRISPQQ
jgi:hypothetical protein